ncbi:cell wall surface anchor family protein [Clostridium sp. CAG:356]|nr:cell wall surface anchor family protein [Clostridium sp. CAG:356]
MKKVLKILLIVLLVIVANIGILVNTVQAVENGEQITIYSKGYFNRVIRNNGIVIKTAHAVYQENGKEYPVYCLNRELHGVGEYIATYDVKDQGKIEDLGLWRVVINGYPYKSIEQLGVTNEEEAYIATKQSIYCYIYNTGTELYSAINEQGERVINAMNNILENAKNSNESFDNPNIEIEQSEKWNVDEIENKYVSKEYKIKSNKNISKITLNLESQPKGTKITNLDEDGKFKILIPIENLKESGKFKIKIQTELETKPIFLGEAPSNDLQNYLLTAYSYEDMDKEFEQEYEKNNTKIIIEKTDNDTNEVLKGAKFEILDEKQKSIRVAETNNDGQVILDGLMPGIYYIKEVQAPNGYSIDSELKKVEIKLNQEISLKIKNNKIIIKQEEPQQPIVEIPKLPVTGM